MKRKHKRKPEQRRRRPRTMNWIRLWLNCRCSMSVLLGHGFFLHRYSRYPPSQRISQAETGKNSLADLLSVSLQHLDGAAEMKRFFGSRVVQANREEGQSSSRKKVPIAKSNLTRPQPNWWGAKGREGLTLRPLTDEETNSKLSRHGWTSIQEKWWTVEYSKKYRSITKAFMQTVLSGGAFYALVSRDGDRAFA